ncbi:Ribosomal large subunit pseudouridine synthase C [Serratia symbiotica]|nr:Ribosomal large subunit pseudouridine synthase C [Serratia symbiotica]
MNINNIKTQIITISDNAVNQRIDNFLFTYLKYIPKSRIYRLIRKGKIRVNKKRIKINYKLFINDMVRIPPLYLINKKKISLSIKLDKISSLTNYILYEDNHLLIINKPSGTAVHGGSGLKFGIIEGLRALRPKSHFLELVHRLDRDTSGILLIAKKRSALRFLHEQLRMKKIKKNYLALVIGKWESQCKTIKVPLLKKNSKNGKWIVYVNKQGKISETHFNIETSYKFATLIKATPITGRTHQIRVHAQYAGHPIAFDNRYGNYEYDKKLFGIDLKRIFLHAYSLHFKHPNTGKMMYIKAKIDKILFNFLQKINNIN